MAEKRIPSGLQGQSIAIIGAEHQGKSHWIKKYLLGPSAVVWDPKNEYHDLKCTTYSPGRIPSNEQLEEFVEYVIGLDKVTPIVEEASIFFASTGKGSQKYYNFMQGRYHNLAIPVNVFQNISEIPHFIYKRTDWFVLFPTGETEAEVKDKYQDTRLHAAFVSRLAKPQQPIIFRKLALVA
jgi:hypothetical protein